MWGAVIEYECLVERELKDLETAEEGEYNAWLAGFMDDAKKMVGRRSTDVTNSMCWA